MDAGELELMDARAVNWGRWAGGGGLGSPGRCASAESRYVAPRPDDEMTARAALPPVDVDGAERFERAVCGLPGQMERRFLKLLYVQCCTRPELARKMRLHNAEMVEVFRRRSLCAVSEAMGSADSVRLIRRGKPIWAGSAGRG